MNPTVMAVACIMAAYLNNAMNSVVAAGGERCAVGSEHGVRVRVRQQKGRGMPLRMIVDSTMTFLLTRLRLRL